MIDIFQEIQKAMEKRELEYISFPDLVIFLNSINKKKVQNPVIGDFLLFKMMRFNPNVYGENAEIFEIFETYDLSDITTDLEVMYDQHVFFDFVHSLNSGKYDPMDWHSFFLSRNFIFEQLGINQGDKGEQQSITSELEISSKFDKKNKTTEELQAKITELENQLQAQQSAVDSQEVLPVSNLDEKYNPTERETHLMMINAMAQMLTNPYFNAHKYIRGKNINKTDMSRDIAQHITKVLNEAATKPREEETIRKRLNEALKLNEQAD